jgi:hypothetical protein
MRNGELLCLTWQNLIGLGTVNNTNKLVRPGGMQKHKEGKNN